MRLKSRIKRVAVAVFALAVMTGAGFTGKAEAIEINSGDLALILYGNGTEYYQNLGSTGTLLAPGATTVFNTSSSTLSAVGGANPVKWALVSYSFDADGNPTVLNSTLNPITPSQTSQVVIGNGWIGLTNFTHQDGLTQQFLPSGNPGSFSNQLDPSGNGSLASTFPVSTTGGFGSTLSVIEGDFTSNIIHQVGTASLSTPSPSGFSLLTISGVAAPAPVPLPASVVLFGTGLLGLVALSRREWIAA